MSVYLNCLTFLTKNILIFLSRSRSNTLYDTKNRYLPKTRLKLVENDPYCKFILFNNNPMFLIRVSENISCFRKDLKTIITFSLFLLTSVQENLLDNFSDKSYQQLYANIMICLCKHRIRQIELNS